ncbi:MAG: flagellar biosynthetic protein FliR [Pseudomonadota bacterium]
MEESFRFSFQLFPELGALKQIMINIAVASARFIGLLLVMPVFKRTELGRAVLAAVGLGFALPLMIALGPQIDAMNTDADLFVILLMVKEVAVGALLGVFFGAPFWAIQAVGELVDGQRSISQSGMTDPATGGQASVLAVLLSFVAIVIFAVEGGIGLMVRTVYESYAIWPLDLILPTIGAAALAEVAAVIGRVLLFGIVVASPLIGIFLLSDAATMGIARMSGRIEVSMLLPLVKNVLFVVFALVYLEFLVGYLRDGVREVGLVSRALEPFVGR